MEEKNGEGWFNGDGRICLGTRRENFSCLCPKLGGLKKNVISGPEWKFQFC